MTSPQNDPHRELMENTQEYLRACMADKLPDAMLVAAWDDFYRVYDVLIRRFVIARGMRGADVDDCVQDVWFEIGRRLATFEITCEAGLRSWMYTLVRSRATDMFRRRARQPAALLGESLQQGFEPPGREGDPSIQSEQAWTDAVVQTMILKLQAEVSELNFEIFRLRSLEGVGVNETAETVGVTSDQIRYRHHRTMKKLKAMAALYLGQEFSDA